MEYYKTKRGYTMRYNETRIQEIRRTLAGPPINVEGALVLVEKLADEEVNRLPHVSQTIKGLLKGEVSAEELRKLCNDEKSRLMNEILSAASKVQ